MYGIYCFDWAEICDYIGNRYSKQKLSEVKRFKILLSQKYVK